MTLNAQFADATACILMLWVLQPTLHDGLDTPAVAGLATDFCLPKNPPKIYG